MAKRVLITGATGFIGRNIAQAMAADERFSVTGVWHHRAPFDHDRIAWRRAELTDPATVAQLVEGADWIIHAAATTSGAGDIVRRPTIHVTDNAVMNSYLFRAAHEAGVGHLVFFSCSIMYASSGRAQTEADYDPAQPLDPRYFAAGSTKLYLEQMCRFYAGLGRTRFTVVRHSNTYGPFDKFDLERSHVFGATVTKVLGATDGRVDVWGDGSEGRDLLYVDDLVAFVRAALDRQPAAFGLYNVGGGALIRIRDLVARIVAAAGRPLDVVFDSAKPTIPVTILLDCALAARELGWRPEVGIDEGIARVLAWRRAHPDL